MKSLYRDCCDLANYIADARREIATMRPGDLKDNQIPRAGLELDAIVKATETATEAIMAATEQIMDEAGRSAPVNDACMRIFEACSFQDITGQRIGKITRTVGAIEDGFHCVAILAGGKGVKVGRTKAIDRFDGGIALEGPQINGPVVSQSDIDKLLD